MTPQIEICVNEDVTGDAVAVVLRGTQVLDIDGELVPVIQLTPAMARQTAQVLVDCADQIEGCEG